MAAGCLLLLGAAALPNAQADEWDKLTQITFSAPTEVPGIVLPAGTYTFTLLDTLADRDVVQVWNADRTKLYTTLLAIPDYRLTPTDKTVVTFEERTKGSPEAVKAWFYPGDQYGLEFVYPRVRATELAQANQQHVPAMPQKMAKTSEVAALKKAPVSAIQPSGKEVALAEVHSAPPPQNPEPVKTAAAATPKTLPKTASLMPIIVLIGLVSLGGGFVLRRVSRSMLGS